MTSSTNPFKNVIQLEEITHYQKPAKSILNLQKSFQYKIPKRVSYFLEDNDDPSGSDEDIKSDHQQPSSSATSSPSPQFANFDRNPPSIFHPSTASSSNGSGQSPSPSSSSPNDHREIQAIPGKRYSELSEDSDDESSDEFHRDFHKSSLKGNDDRMMTDGISDENLFPLPSLDITKWDLIFSFIVLLVNISELACDFILVIWHYQTDHPWGCGLTLTFLALGGLGMLHQFSLLQQDQLDRLFRKSKRVRILINCFPPAASTIVSVENALAAWRAHNDPMVCQQFFQIQELSKSLSRIQSFFQAAPLATLQFVIYMESYHESSFEKAMLTFISIIVSLVVMTNANLPSKTDLHVEDGSLHKAAYLPLTRIFVGLRMFSSLASRCMALTYLLVGSRCLLVPDTSSSFASTLIAFSLLLIPRLIFTTADYIASCQSSSRNLEHYMDSPELGVSSSHPISRLPFIDMFTGYLATIFFPVGDPLWLFWYLWTEAGIFIIFGNVSGLTHDCFDHSINMIFTGIFLVVFIMIPVVIPYTKVLVNSQKLRRFNRVARSVTTVEDSLHEQQQPQQQQSSSHSEEVEPNYYTNYANTKYSSLA